VRDEARVDYREASQEKYYNHYRDGSVTPSMENDPKSAPSPFILEVNSSHSKKDLCHSLCFFIYLKETSSYCLSHGLPKPIPKFSGYESSNGLDVRHTTNGYNNHYSQKFNGFDGRDKFSRVNGHADQNGSEVHRAQLVRFKYTLYDDSRMKCWWISYLDLHSWIVSFWSFIVWTNISSYNKWNHQELWWLQRWCVKNEWKFSKNLSEPFAQIASQSRWNSTPFASPCYEPDPPGQWTTDPESRRHTFLSVPSISRKICETKP